MNNFFKNYRFNLINILSKTVYDNDLYECGQIFKNCKKKKKKIILLGNGGSSSIASHVSVDLSKNAKIRSVNFNEPSLITCLSNDYGYIHWMQRALEIYSEKGDVIILISSSGRSKNIINAAKWIVKKKNKLITLTGFNRNNPLLKVNSKGINFFVNSKSYNYVELTHLYLLLSIIDFLIGKTVYRNL